MPLPQSGGLLYNDLREKLISFQRATVQDRQVMLRSSIDALNTLDARIENKEQAINAYRQLTYTATLINYANALWRIDNQEFFDILIDFKMPEIFENPAFHALKNYFEFHPKAPQMRLLQPHTIIPPAIWQLFRDAQKAQLQAKGKAGRFKLDELDISNLPPDQLYPLPIQMFGRYQNEAVDRAWATANGEYTFANRHGAFLLPGGGMIEVDLKNTLENTLLKMLDEHLEEQHGNLWYKAASYYDAIERTTFLETFQSIINKPKLNPEIHHALTTALSDSEEHATNAKIIANIVQKIDALITQYPTEKKDLNVLRASIQVEPFKLTDLYKEAAAYIKENAVTVKIEQFGDTRACGGRQISNAYLMFGNDLLAWFGNKFNNIKAETADDIRGSELVSMTLLEALERFASIKFSHILIVLAHQVESLETNHVQFDNVWNHDQFTAARTTLLAGIEHAIQKCGTTMEKVLLQQPPVKATVNRGHGFFVDPAVSIKEEAERSAPPEPDSSRKAP